MTVFVDSVTNGFQAVTGGLEGRRALLPPLAALTQRAWEAKYALHTFHYKLDFKNWKENTYF